MYLLAFSHSIHGYIHICVCSPPLIRPTSVWKVAVEVVGPRSHVMSDSEAFSFTIPLRKAWIEAPSGLRHFLLQILWEELDYKLWPLCSFFLHKPFKKRLITGWSWCGACSFTNPLQVLVRKAWLQAGTVLRPIHLDFSLPIQLLADSLIQNLILQLRKRTFSWQSQPKHIIQAFKTSF